MGLKENVIVGRLVPCGTALLCHSKVEANKKIKNSDKQSETSKEIRN